MICSKCETPYSNRNGQLYENCRCNEVDSNDIIDTVSIIETVIEIAEEINDSYDNSYDDSYDNE